MSKEDRRVFDVTPPEWDMAPYSLASEIRERIKSLLDEGSACDSGHGLGPIPGTVFAELWPHVGGVEFHVTIQRSVNQLLADGYTREQLGLSSTGETE